MEIELGKRRSDKDKLVITEIPYTMIGAGINKFLVDVAELVERHEAQQKESWLATNIWGRG